MCYISTIYHTTCSHYSRYPSVHGEACPRASTTHERAHGCWDRVDLGVDSTPTVCADCKRSLEASGTTTVDLTNDDSTDDFAYLLHRRQSSADCARHILTFLPAHLPRKMLRPAESKESMATSSSRGSICTVISANQGIEMLAKPANASTATITPATFAAARVTHDNLHWRCFDSPRLSDMDISEF